MSFGLNKRTAAQQQILSIKVNLTSGGTFTSEPAASSAGIVARNINQTVVVTFTPSTNWSLLRWELDGVSQGTTNPITITMDAHHLLVAIVELAAVEASWVYSPPGGSPQTLGTTVPSITLTKSGNPDQSISISATISNVTSTGGDTPRTLAVTSSFTYAGS